ncbi:hypothetical protein [Shimazuella kribbensis]|uniref:hypothetical protein n=1 Tax=Shimazuella kribbensis TaxID=139808 RepID=UPI0003F9E404|nr:hypothetical protein [Shimazuella kribbensis]
MSDYTPKPTPNYMSSDWGSNQTKLATLNIDHIADKAKFAIEILEASVKAFDSLEKEIVDASHATNPITREGLRAFSYRIDTQQQQLIQGLQHLKQMMDDIDKTTDSIQKQKTNW